MNRRKYVSCVATIAAVGISGCLDDSLEAVEDVGNENQEFGEVVNHRGVEVVPTEWMTTDEVTTDVDQGMTQDRSPETGAEFLLTHIEALNDGDNRRELPSRSSVVGGTSGRSIRVYYAGEETETIQFEDISSAYEVDGVSLTPYHQSRLDQDATGEVYPGVGVEGWIIAEITEGFDIDQTTIEITLGSGDELETFEWAYSTAAEVSPDDISENEGTIPEI